MRPVLLKSAGIVGLAGAIMAVVSSNALFVDPGGPPRGQQSAAEEQQAGPSLTIVTVAPRTSDSVDPTGLAGVIVPPQGRAETLTPPAPAQQPETTASVSPPEPDAPPAPPQPVATAAVDSDAPAAVPAIAPAAPEPAVAAADPVSEPVDEVDQAGEVSVAAASKEAWPKDAVACPRDWVDVSESDSPPSGVSCDTIAQIIQSESSTPPLHKAFSEDVLDIVALAPTIPVASPNGDQPEADAETQASAPPKPEPRPKPTPVRASRRSDWPATPPPDCGSKHAYWHFVDRKTGKKEWYCR